MKFNCKNKWVIERKLKDLPVGLKRILVDNASLTKRKIKNNKDTKKLTEFDLKVMNAICYCNISLKNSKKQKIKYII